MRNISDLLADLKENKVEKGIITHRQLFNYFGFERRTSGNCEYVDDFLKENELEVISHS